MKKLSVVFVVVLLLFGCSSNKEVSKDLPSWYLNTPSNDSQYLYGSGSGYSKEESKNDALSNISSSLQVQIKSKFTQKKEAIREGKSSVYYSNSTSKKLEAKSLKIDYQNVKIQHIKQLNSKIYTLVRVDKKALIKQKLYQLQEKDIYIAKNMDLSVNDNKNIATIKTYKKISPDITEARYLVNLLKILGYDFDEKCYTENYMNYDIDYQKAIKNLKIGINSNNKYFRNMIVSYVNKNGFQINNNQSDIVIQNKNIITNSKYRGWYIVKVNSNVEVKQKNKSGEKTLKNTIINSVGRSSTSKDLALQNASKIFDKKLKEKTIEDLLF
jgi:hypothetical protein